MKHNSVVVKAPYTTNKNYKGCKNLTEAISHISTLQKAYRRLDINNVPFYLIPYVMVQPKLINRREYKV